MSTRVRSIVAGFALASLVVLAQACNSSQAPPPQTQTAAAPQQKPVDPLERGKHLVTVSGCNDCHTPWKMGPSGPEPDMTRMLSGHPENMKMPPAPKPSGPWTVTAAATFTAWSGPWGVSYTMNLTPDQNTGIGTWSEETFIAAIRNGQHMGKGRPILPPMPWPAYRNYNDDDLKAIYAYLKTIPAISNHVPDPVIAEPPKNAK